MSETSDLVQPTEVHQKLVFSVIRMLQGVNTPSRENLEGICHALAHEFNIDAAGIGGVHDADVDVLEAFKSALAEKQKKLSPEQDEKFAAFVELLGKKGYFNGVEPGTDDYNARLAKAREKFNQRNNPYEGLSGEQLKTKGNELMTQAKYKEAIAYYTKAIELEPTNYIYYANRSAAHIHMKDYRSAIMDCEKSVSINEKYSKAWNRLGRALYYDRNYARAVDAYMKSIELEPENETYKADLKEAEEKLKSTGVVPGAGGFPGMGGVNPFGGGQMPDFSQMAGMMNNPQFLETANRMMQNPEFANLVSNMAGKFGGMGMPNPEEMQKMMMGQRTMDGEGNITTPFGKVNKARMEEIEREECEKNPRLAAAIADLRLNGPSVMSKYMADPEVMSSMMKLQSAVMGTASE